MSRDGFTTKGIPWSPTAPFDAEMERAARQASMPTSDRIAATERWIDERTRTDCDRERIDGSDSFPDDEPEDYNSEPPVVAVEGFVRNFLGNATATEIVQLLMQRVQELELLLGRVRCYTVVDELAAPYARVLLGAIRCHGLERDIDEALKEK
jgi:RimJ/RimL family protein N-acetyltransferase